MTQGLLFDNRFLFYTMSSMNLYKCPHLANYTLRGMKLCIFSPQNTESFKKLF